jgi:4-hydroxybenzoate polyprenyltransferase
LKEHIASKVIPNPALLRYRTEVIDHLKREKAAGREIILVTGANLRIAKAVAEHLGLFSAVLASEGQQNLVGSAKTLAIRELLGDTPFCYIGNSRADIPVWADADEAILLNPSPTLLHDVAKLGNVSRAFTTSRSSLDHIWKLVRPHHWAKNILLIVPLITSHTFCSISNTGGILVAIVAFSLVASSGYIINDICDARFDRQHPYKFVRPIASGSIGTGTGLILSLVLFATGGTIALSRLPMSFVNSLLIYIAASVAYSMFAKRVPIIDVLLLASLYTLRVIAGGLALNISVSPWLLAFSMFEFLSLAFAKRFFELTRCREAAAHSFDGRGYSFNDRQMIGTSGMIAGYAAIIVFAFYISSADAAKLYRSPQFLWLVCPVLLYWIQRVWLLAFRGVGISDPVVFAFRDKTSYGVGLVAAALLWLAWS